MFKKFVQFNIKISHLLAKKFPGFFIGNKIAKKDLVKLIKNYIVNKNNLDILEIGGIDRPILEKNLNYKYSGLDIEFKENCNDLYDDFIVQSIEDEIPKKYDLIFSSTLIEHVRNNNKSFSNIYNCLKDGGCTLHYIPCKNHFYSIILRLVGPKLQKFLIRNLRPNVSLIKTGYPAFFHLCSPKEIKILLEKIGYKDIKIITYFKATEYFAFLTPLYIIIACFENLFEKLKINFFASGLIIRGEK